jgi:hypothetical protein
MLGRYRRGQDFFSFMCHWVERYDEARSKEMDSVVEGIGKSVVEGDDMVTMDPGGSETDKVSNKRKRDDSDT